MIVRVRVNNPVEAEKVARRVGHMRQSGILSEPQVGCPATGCTCKTLRESLSCENWKRVDVL